MKDPNLYFQELLSILTRIIKILEKDPLNQNWLNFFQSKVSEFENLNSENIEEFKDLSYELSKIYSGAGSFNDLILNPGNILKTIDDWNNWEKRKQIIPLNQEFSHLRTQLFEILVDIRNLKK